MLPMTQEQLWDALGLMPVHINRTLHGLRGDGLSSFERGRIETLDPFLVESLAELDPEYLLPDRAA